MYNPDVVQVISLERDEYLALKAHLAKLRGYSTGEAAAATEGK